MLPWRVRVTADGVGTLDAVHATIELVDQAELQPGVFAFSGSFGGLSIVQIDGGQVQVLATIDDDQLGGTSSGSMVRHHDGIVYLTSERNDGALAIVDVSDPATPTVISTTVGGLSGGISAHRHGDYVYVVRYSGVTVVDVSDPAVPVVGTTIAAPTGTFINGALVGDHLAVVESSFGGLYTYSLASPATPSLDGQITYTDDARLTSLQQVTYDPDTQTAWAVGQDQSVLVGIDLSDPSLPTVAGSVVDSRMFEPGGMTVTDGSLAVADYNQWYITVFDVSAPSTPTLTYAVGNRGATQTAYGTAFLTSEVVVAMRETGSGNQLVVIDLATDTELQTIPGSELAEFASVWPYAQGDWIVRP